MAPKAPSIPPITLEGTTLEGGGQLLRLALGLSSLTKKPININQIRGRRSGGGGLKTQHLTCVQWLGQACKARLSGVGLKSKEITFTPDAEYKHDELEAGEARITQSTPGSVNLVFQAVLPYLLFSGAQSPIRLRISGGTNVSNSPSFEYIDQVLVPMLQLVGVPQFKTELHSRGWSQGTTRIGSLTYTVTPLQAKLPAFQLIERGDICSIKATVLAPKEMEQNFRDELDVMFDKRSPRFFGSSTEPQIEVEFEDSHHEKRFYLLLVATTTKSIKLGRDWLYDQGIRPGKVEKVIPTLVKKVSDDLLAELEHGGCVDEFMRDQLVVFQALADGKSAVYGGRLKKALVEPSLHAKTAQWVAKQIVGVTFDGEGTCEGVGFSPGDGPQKEPDLTSRVDELRLDA